MIKRTIAELIQKKDLSLKDAEEVFREIFTKDVSSSQIAAFLVALRNKGESEREIFAAAKVIRGGAKKINVKDRFSKVSDRSNFTIDTCGTGGSGINKLNISTAISFVVGASGIRVAKHGNRAMSSESGSADVLEKLGIKVNAPPSVMEAALKNVGICFLYAPLYHPVLANVAKIRREIGVRTIFNILGPLSYPANPTHQLLGVYNKKLLYILAKVLRRFALKKALVVYSSDLKDEVSLNGITYAALLNGRVIKKIAIRPSVFGLKKIKLKDIEVSGPSESAAIINDIFLGRRSSAYDVVLANASCCFYILGKAKNLKEGVSLAKYIIDTGKARDKFIEFKDFINKRVGH